MNVTVELDDFLQYAPRFPGVDFTPEKGTASITPGFVVGWVSDDDLAEYDPKADSVISVVVELPGDSTLHIRVPFKQISPVRLSEAEKAVWLSAVKKLAGTRTVVT